MREEEDMNQGNDKKAEDQVETVVTLANDWIHKESVLKFPNRNVPGFQLQEGRNQPVL